MISLWCFYNKQYILDNEIKALFYGHKMSINYFDWFIDLKEISGLVSLAKK